MSSPREPHVTLEPEITIVNKGNTDENRDSEMFDVDIDDLTDQLGIGNIQRTLKALNDRLASLDSLPAVPESGKGFHTAVEPFHFDPTANLSDIHWSATSESAEIRANSQKEKKSIEASSILPLIADAVTFLGHTPYLTSLKRREFLTPDIAQAYQSVCS